MPAKSSSASAATCLVHAAVLRRVGQVPVLLVNTTNRGAVMIRRARGAETRAHWEVRLSLDVQLGMLVEHVEIAKTTRGQFEVTCSMSGLGYAAVIRGVGVVRVMRGSGTRAHWTASQHLAVRLGTTVGHVETEKSKREQLGTVDAMYVVV